MPSIILVMLSLLAKNDELKWPKKPETVEKRYSAINWNKPQDIPHKLQYSCIC